ncbi:hypothetical protein LWC35_28150 [Pseudonocardia kujensis]|uniref:hypothetical protein n=1 Tax=Pseudonocardia kujensis TaxID=1128675 RepID=UPI001E5AFEB6|nr:hypothetical protein [Pseudonocardia kujensis]MCE0766750.1 hypothetical protein [Pseudonocardia kujensis]
MTAAPHLAPSALHTPGRRRRPLAVARMQLINLPVQLGMPWLILALAFAINLVIFALVPDPPAGEPKVTGGLLSIYIFVVVAHLVTMTQVFPFALGLSVTRRDFFTGTALFVLAQAAVQGLLLTLLLVLEEATGGWGMGLHFFGVPFLVQQNWVLQWLVYTVPFLLFSFVSILAGTIYKRFGQLGMWTASIGLLLAGGIAAVLLTWQQAWPAVGRFFSDTPAAVLFAGYPAVLAALAAGVAYLFLRRATV